MPLPLGPSSAVREPPGSRARRCPGRRSHRTAWSRAAPRSPRPPFGRGSSRRRERTRAGEHHGSGVRPDQVEPLELVLRRGASGSRSARRAGPRRPRPRRTRRGRGRSSGRRRRSTPQRIAGSVTRRNVASGEAPSVQAASSWSVPISRRTGTPPAPRTAARRRSSPGPSPGSAKITWIPCRAATRPASRCGRRRGSGRGRRPPARARTAGR